MVKAEIVRSGSYDPWYNLALEQYLLQSAAQQDQVILYLWQNQHTVVIGRNQNAWKQCRCSLLAEEGGKLARRLSGGGAVYHDLGNLNFTFLAPIQRYDLERQLEVILQAVQSRGIDAAFSGRNDLTAQGRKFSGNAFYQERKGAYHHGTLLVDVNVEDMVKYLQVSEEKMRSKAVESVRARVINLKALDPSLSIEAMAQAVQESFIENYGGNPQVRDIDPDRKPLTELYDKYSSWEWRFGNTPTFEVEFATRFDWGEIEVGLNVHKGIISAVQFWSDAMNSTLIGQLAPGLEGAVLQSEAIKARLEAIPVGPEDAGMMADIGAWLEEKVTNM